MRVYPSPCSTKRCEMIGLVAVDPVQDVSFQQKSLSFFCSGFGGVFQKSWSFWHFLKQLTRLHGVLEIEAWQNQKFPGRLYGLGVAPCRLFSQGIEARSGA